MKKEISTGHAGKDPSTVIGRSLGTPFVLYPAVIILLAYLFTVSILEMRIHSASFDELVHLPAGVTYLKTGDFRMNPQHPPLVKILSAVPVLFLKPHLDLTHPAWQQGTFDQWIFGFYFMHTNDAERLLFWGRMPIVLLSLLLGIFVFIWARELYGNSAALVALTLYVFSPDVIAHSHFVTMDLALSAFFLMTLYFFWKWLNTGKIRFYMMTAFFLGCALAAKYSAVILLLAMPAILLILGFRKISPGERAAPSPNGKTDPSGQVQSTSRGGAKYKLISRPIAFDDPVQRFMALALASCILVVLAMIVVQGSYLFSPDLTAYFDGMRQVNIDHASDYQYYLFGEFKTGGWWYYFPLAMLVKTPLPVLILVGISLFGIIRHRERFLRDEIFVLLPALVLLCFTMAYADNIGVRYLLPMSPLLFIFSSRIMRFRMKRWFRHGMIGVLGVWYISSSLFIFPDHLAFFNEFAGGPSRGCRYLDDSNLEWGQDFKRMIEYVRKNDISDAFFLTWPVPWPAGTDSYYGVRAQNIDFLGVDAVMGRPPEPGTYLISTHFLVRLKLHAHRTGNRHFDWLVQYEPVDRVGYSFFVYRFK